MIELCRRLPRERAVAVQAIGSGGSRYPI